MKRTSCILISAVFIIAMLSGCARHATAFGTSSNDILTYRKLDTEKTTVVVSYTGNIYLSGFNEAFEKRNPDVQVVCVDITGGNGKSIPIIDVMENGAAPDVMFFTGNFLLNEMTTKYFTNLSANPVVGRYESERLNNVAVNGEIYWLPGPSSMNCMIYNKTLFEQYGWEVPSTFDEFIALCDRITKDTDGKIEPWNPNAKYANEFMTAMEGFLYEELFGGVENRVWYDNIIEGTGKYSPHMKPMYDAIQTLADHNILREEHFSYSATTRGKEFLAGKIAMINGSATNYSSDAYEFDYMPFPSASEELGYISETYSCMVGVPVKEHSKTEQSAIDRYLEYFSSEEGQLIYIGDSMMRSNIKNVGFSDADKLASLTPAVSEGHMFSMLDFYGKKGRVDVAFSEVGLAVSKGEKTGDECLSEDAAKPYIKNDEKIILPEALAYAGKNFSILETSQYIADMYKETADAEIGLIENNVAYRGNLMRIFAGEITSYDINAMLPRSFFGNSKLVKAKMTGQQLLDALNNPLGSDCTANCIYAFSGLKCTVAPWNDEGKRYISVALADGTPINKDRLYTVAFWEGTVNEKYITEIAESFDGSWEALMTAKLTEDKTITPADDGRITLVWD